MDKKRRERRNCLERVCLWTIKTIRKEREREREREPIWHARDGWIRKCFVLQQLSDRVKLVHDVCVGVQVWTCYP